MCSRLSSIDVPYSTRVKGHQVFHRPLRMPDRPKRIGETIKLMPNAPDGLGALHVNRGIGTVGAPPEITHFVLDRV